MRRAFIFLLIFHGGICGLSQTTKQSLLSPYIKTSAYTNQQADVFSFSANQAALAQSKYFSAGILSERKFLLQELNLFSAAIALPTHSGNFGLQIHHYGNASYNEMQAGLAYGRKLSDYVDVGAQFNYYRLQIAGYGNASAINFEAGAIFHFTDQLQGGIHFYNPTSSKLGKDQEENLPSVYSLGFGYDASEDFFISAEIEKTENSPLNVNTTIQYKITDRLLARGGVGSATSIYFLGLGFTWENFRVDAMASVHPQLGITPGLLLIYTKPDKD